MATLKDILLEFNESKDEKHTVTVQSTNGNISSACDGHPAIILFYLYHHLRDEGYTMQHVADALSAANAHYEYIQEMANKEAQNEHGDKQPDKSTIIT